MKTIIIKIGNKKIKLNVGDKLYCYNAITLNLKYHYYTIISIDNNNEIKISTEIDPNGVLSPYRNFYIHKQVDRWSKMSDHFIPLCQTRKLKLEKLNESCL